MSVLTRPKQIEDHERARETFIVPDQRGTLDRCATKAAIQTFTLEIKVENETQLSSQILRYRMR